MGVGAVLLLGHPARTSGPSFTYLRDIADVRAWGAAFVLAGALAAWGSLRRRAWPGLAGHFLCGFLCAFLVACFWAARAFPTASLTGVVAYATIAAGHLCAVSTFWARRV